MLVVTEFVVMGTSVPIAALLLSCSIANLHNFKAIDFTCQMHLIGCQILLRHVNVFTGSIYSVAGSFRVSLLLSATKFLHLSLILSKGAGVCLSAWWDTPSTEQTPPRADTPTHGSHCSRRYTSYWNAFLFIEFFVVNPFL